MITEIFADCNSTFAVGFRSQSADSVQFWRNWPIARADRGANSNYLRGHSRCGKATKPVIIWMHNAEANQDMKLTSKTTIIHSKTTCINTHPHSYLLHTSILFFAMPNSTEAEIPHPAHRFKWQKKSISAVTSKQWYNTDTSEEWRLIWHTWRVI